MVIGVGTRVLVIYTLGGLWWRAPWGGAWLNGTGTGVAASLRRSSYSVTDFGSVASPVGLE